MVIEYSFYRVNALCSGRAECCQEAFQKGFVLNQSFALILDAALGRVLFEQVQGHFADQGQVLGGLVVAQVVMVLAKGDIELPIQGVFNGSVPAHESIGLGGRERPAADVVARLSNELSFVRRPACFHPHHRAQPRPAATLVYPAQVRLRPDPIAHRDAVVVVGPTRVGLPGG